MCRGGENSSAYDIKAYYIFLYFIVHIIIILFGRTGNNNNSTLLSPSSSSSPPPEFSRYLPPAHPTTPPPATPFRHATAAMTPECLPNAINNRDVVVPLIRSLRLAPPEQCRPTELVSSPTPPRQQSLYFLFLIFFVPEKLGRSVLHE